MKVLHLPSNTASQTSITVRALRDIGVDARGLIVGGPRIQDSQGLEVLPRVDAPMRSFRGVICRLPLWRSVLSAIRWADVVHWHFSSRVMPRGLDLRYTRFLNKARIVEFCGSDIRMPSIASSDNPYMARLYEEHREPWMSDACARDVQARFAKFGFECLIRHAELEPYVQRDLFPRVYRTEARLILSEFEPRYPDPSNQRPLVVHSPSKKAVKGTDAVLRAVEVARTKYDFDFRLIHGMEHAAALDAVRNCDVVLDQFVVGDYGVAALEGMAFGKPTICYIKPSLAGQYASLPIVNADQENLPEVLGDLLSNGQKRYDIGRRSRAFVEQHHDAHEIARYLRRIYEELLEKVGT